MQILYIYLELNSIFGKVGPVVGVMIIGLTVLSNIYISWSFFFKWFILHLLGQILRIDRNIPHKMGRILGPHTHDLSIVQYSRVHHQDTLDF